MKKALSAAAAGGAYLLPALALAAQQGSQPTLGNLETLLKAIGNLVSIATPIVVGLALLVFFWGLVKYLLAKGDDDKKSGKSLMIGGIIAIFVMVSVVGIVKFIGRAFGIEGDQGGSLPVPTVEVEDVDLTPYN